jgi:nitroreductase
MREPPAFDEAFRARLRELFVWRRDVRRFRVDPLPEGSVARLIEVACLSPSVGLSQPWRFVLVDDAARRQAVIADFKECNARALQSYCGEDAARYAARERQVGKPRRSAVADRAAVTDIRCSYRRRGSASTSARA